MTKEERSEYNKNWYKNNKTRKDKQTQEYRKERSYKIKKEKRKQTRLKNITYYLSMMKTKSKKESKKDIGYVYFLESPMLPGITKIGMTGDDPIKRINDINRDKYGYVNGWKMIHQMEHVDHIHFERKCHKLLAKYKHQLDNFTELFQMSANEAYKLILESPLGVEILSLRDYRNKLKNDINFSLYEDPEYDPIESEMNIIDSFKDYYIKFNLCIDNCDVYISQEEIDDIFVTKNISHYFLDDVEYILKIVDPHYYLGDDFQDMSGFKCQLTKIDKEDNYFDVVYLTLDEEDIIKFIENALDFYTPKEYFKIISDFYENHSDETLLHLIR